MKRIPQSYLNCLAALLVLVSITYLGVAVEHALVSPDARTAKNKHTRSCEDAEMTYKGKIKTATLNYFERQLAAKSMYLTDLKAAKSKLKGSKLSIDAITKEAQVIGAEIERATADIASIRKQLSATMKWTPELPEIEGATTKPNKPGKPVASKKLALITIVASRTVKVGVMKEFAMGLHNRSYITYMNVAKRWHGMYFTQNGVKRPAIYKVTALTDGVFFVIGTCEVVGAVSSTAMAESGISARGTLGASMSWTPQVFTVEVKKGDTATITGRLITLTRGEGASIMGNIKSLTPLKK